MEKSAVAPPSAAASEPSADARLSANRIAPPLGSAPTLTIPTPPMAAAADPLKEAFSSGGSIGSPSFSPATLSEIFSLPSASARLPRNCAEAGLPVPGSATVIFPTPPMAAARPPCASAALSDTTSFSVSIRPSPAIAPPMAAATGT